MQRKKHNTKYSPEFKISVIMDMRENHLAYRETARKYKLGNSVCQGKNLAIKWERIYLTEGAEGRPRKKPLPTEVENDLIAENQRLKEQLQYAEMELEYLKKLDALVRAAEERNGRKPK